MNGNLIGLYGRELASIRQEELASAARMRRTVRCVKQARRAERAARIAGAERAHTSCPVDRG